MLNIKLTFFGEGAVTETARWCGTNPNEAGPMTTLPPIELKPPRRPGRFSALFIVTMTTVALVSFMLTISHGG